MAIVNEKLINIFETMVRIRCFEERVAKEYREGHTRFVHLCNGQEAIAAGACAALRPDDYILSTHRGHGHAIAKGLTTDRMMAELYGKRNGYCRGKGGSVHMADTNIGHLGSQGIVGAGIPIATGVALSAKMRGTDQVALCFFGDGACNTARFHEGINLGSIWKLPIVYIIESNLWAALVPQSYSTNLSNLADRATAYGIPGMVVDGNDVIAVYEAVGEAVARARRGGGPTLVECKTCRLRGGFEGDLQSYRPKGEVEEWMEKEPIKRFREQLIGMGVLTEKETDRIEREMLEEMDRAVTFAEESPFPDPKEIFENIYA